MDVLRDWQEAAALVLSCPGPLRRHPKALMKIADAALPQVFLGGESQLTAFAAAAPEKLREKLFFAPLPEMFSGIDTLAGAWRAIGQPVHDPDRILHLRFGSIRDVRVLKGVHNVAVLAEAAGTLPITTSLHPLASGAILPATVEAIFLTEAEARQPRRFGAEALPSLRLQPDLRTADFMSSTKPIRGRDSLDCVTLADFASDLWAAGPVKPAPNTAGKGGAFGSVLVPWNLADYGSIVPELLRRIASLWHAGAPVPAPIVLPFNYLGQTGILRRFITDLRDAAFDPKTILHDFRLARVTRLSGLAALKKLSATAWVDGNDPEHRWTLARLGASGFKPILLDPGVPQPSALSHPAEEPIRVESDTRYGTLCFDARIPSLRSLRSLLALTRDGAPP